MAAPSRAARLVVAVERQADRPWFLPAAGFFPLTDYVLPFLPNQLLLLALSAALPRRWWQLALTFVLATGLGAALTALAVQAWGPPLLERLFGGIPEESAAAGVLAAVERHGLWALLALAMLPWPPRTAVLACALAGLPPLSIGMAVAAGRVVPAGGYTLAGAFAPHLLRRIPAVGRALAEVEHARAAGRPDAGR